MGVFLFLCLFSDCVDFSYSEGLFFSGIFHIFYCAFLLSGSVLSSRARLSSEDACSYFLCR